MAKRKEKAGRKPRWGLDEKRITDGKRKRSGEIELLQENWKKLHEPASTQSARGEDRPKAKTKSGGE